MQLAQLALDICHLCKYKTSINGVSAVIFREARRFLRSSPILSLSAIVILALGIGASALALALLLAFSSLTYPGMRVLGYATIAEETEGGGSVPITWQQFDELRGSSLQNAKLVAYSRLGNATLEVNGGGRPLRVAAVSSGFFPVAAGLSAGRDFNLAEESQAGRHVIILSSLLAATLFTSPEAALNQVFVINRVHYDIIGVARPGFQGLFGDSVDAWVPANCEIPLLAHLPDQVAGSANPDAWKTVSDFYGIAASDQLSSAGLVSELSRSLPLRTIGESPLHVSQGLTADPVRDAKLRKWLRLGFLLALVFTIVSGLNYCMLLLARTPRYAEEVRLKKALGAGSGRLMTELMAGPAVMVGAGLLAASFFWVGGLMLISRLSAFYEQLVGGSWHAAILAYSVQAPLACALTLVIALFPALGLLRNDGAPHLGTTSTPSRRTGIALQSIVTLQITFCIGTWILAGMIISAVTSLTRAPLGYDPSHLSVVNIGPASEWVSFSAGGGDTFPPVSAIQSLLEQVTALPGVRSASFAETAPFDSPMGTITVQRMESASEAPRTVNETAVSPDYFRTMGTRIVRGKDFSWQNLTGDLREVIINESLARELWPEADPVGRSIRIIYPTFAGMRSFSLSTTVVGVVEDTRFSGFTESPEPTLFESLKGGAFVTSHLLVNGSESLHSLQDVASHEVATQMPELAVQRAYSVGERARAALWQEKERAYFALAGALAMALIAYIGLYGALAYYVNTRRRELAVRVCFGAPAWAIRKIILTRAAQCAAAAALLSLPLWPVLARLSSNDYLGRVSWSAGRAILLSLACISVAIFISLVPAAAATRTSPAEVLKEQ